MTKSDEKKHPKTEKTAAELATDQSVLPPLSTESAPSLDTTAILKQLESQQKLHIILAVLLGVAFIWLAFISARMYATSPELSKRNFMMHQSQPWGNSSTNGNSMMDDNDSIFQFR